MIYTVELIKYTAVNSLETSTVEQLILADNSPSVIERADEVLDAGYVEVLSYEQEPFSMYDTIRFTVIDDFGNSHTQSMRINEDEVEIESKSDLLYRHRLKLIEHTVMLDLELIQNRYFSQPIDGSLRYKTVESIVTNLIETTPLQEDVLVNSTRVVKKYEDGDYFNTRDKAILSATPPEIQLPIQTLRDAINENLKSVNSVIRMNENRQVYLRQWDLVNDTIDNVDTSSETRVKSTDNYCTSVTSEAVNVMNDDNLSIRTTYPSSIGYTSLRDESGVFDENNAVLKIPASYGFGKMFYVVARHPILEKLNVADLDITNYVLEEGVWSQLQTRSNFNPDGSDLSVTYRPYKNNTVKFSYGDNKITGWGGVSKYVKSTIFGNKIYSTSVWVLLLMSAYSDLLTKDDTQVEADKKVKALYDSLKNGDILDLKLRVSFSSITKEIVFDTLRNETTENKWHSQIVSNQKENMVSFNKMANHNKGLANRASNATIEINTVVTRLDELLELQDYYKKYDAMVVQREIEYVKDKLNVKYLLNRNFNRLSEFIALNAKPRQYEVSINGSQVTRTISANDVIEYNLDSEVELKGSNFTDNGQLWLSQTSFGYRLGSSNTTYSSLAYVAPYDTNGNLVAPLGMGVTPNVSKDTITMSIGFEDTLNAGYTLGSRVQLLDENGVGAKYRYVEESIPYTDANGITNRIAYKFPVTTTSGSYLRSSDYANNIPRIDATQISTSGHIIEVGNPKTAREDISLSFDNKQSISKTATIEYNVPTGVFFNKTFSFNYTASIGSIGGRKSFVVEVYGITNSGSQVLLDRNVVNTSTISKSVTLDDVGMTAISTIKVVATCKVVTSGTSIVDATVTLNTSNVRYTYYKNTSVTASGLLIKKDVNEKVLLNHTLHLISNDKDFVIGNGLSKKICPVDIRGNTNASRNYKYDILITDKKQTSVDKIDGNIVTTIVMTEVGVSSRRHNNMYGKLPSGYSYCCIDRNTKELLWAVNKDFNFISVGANKFRDKVISKY